MDKELQESEERAQKLEAEALLQTFWSESENIVMKAPSGHKLKDVARYEVKVKESIIPEGDLHELDAEEKVFFKLSAIWTNDRLIERTHAHMQAHTHARTNKQTNVAQITVKLN